MGLLLARFVLVVAAWTVSIGARAQDDVPFITSPDKVTLAMLEIADVTAKDVVVDLGSGDGRIVITAARRFGARGLGVEIVPDLVTKSRANARTAGVAERAAFREQNLFDTELRDATVVTMYLLPEFNLKLRERLLALAPGTRVVSHDWDMGDWQPDRTVTLDVPDKAIGLEKRSRVHLWVVPARVHGTWCGPERSTLRLEQRFQRYSATLTQARAPREPALAYDGVIGGGDGRTLDSPGAIAGLRLQAVGEGELRVLASPPALTGLAGGTFRRASASGC